MQDNLVYRDGDYSIYKNWLYGKWRYTAYRARKIGDFDSIELAKFSCKEKKVRSFNKPLILTIVLQLGLIVALLFDRG